MADHHEDPGSARYEPPTDVPGIIVVVPVLMGIALVTTVITAILMF